MIYKYCKAELSRLMDIWIATTKPKLSAEFQQTRQLNESGTETVNMWAEENYFKVCKDTACASWENPFDLVSDFWCAVSSPNIHTSRSAMSTPSQRRPYKNFWSAKKWAGPKNEIGQEGERGRNRCKITGRSLHVQMVPSDQAAG